MGRLKHSTTPHTSKLPDISHSFAAGTWQPPKDEPACLGRLLVYRDRWHLEPRMASAIGSRTTRHWRKRNGASRSRLCFLEWLVRYDRKQIKTRGARRTSQESLPVLAFITVVSASAVALPMLTRFFTLEVLQYCTLLSSSKIRYPLPFLEYI